MHPRVSGLESHAKATMMLPGLATVFIAAAFACCAWAASTELGPSCVLSKESISFGKVFACDDNVQAISVTNCGNAPLEIRSVKSSCSCTSAEISRTTIEPREHADLTVRLHLDNYPQDGVDVYVSLETNDPKDPLLQIPVRAEIQPEYVVTPASLDFGSVKRGSNPSITLRLIQVSKQEVDLLRVETPSELTVAFKQEERGPRSSGDASKKAFGITVRLNTGAAGEALNTRLFLLTNIPRMARFPVQVQARVIGIECTITPRVAVFGPVPPGSDACTIEITGINDLRLLDASCTVTDLDVQVREVQPEKSYKVLVKIKDSATAGNKVGKLRLTLQEGALTETRELAVYGTVSVLP